MELTSAVTVRPAARPAREYGPRELFSATVAHLTSSDRYHRMRRAITDWLFIENNRLPVRFLAQLWPEIGQRTVDLRMEFSHAFELPYGERAVLAAITDHLQPKTIFEFGTFTGTTTRLLADAVPSATVHTLDLPDEEIVWEDWIGGLIGKAFRARAEYAQRIVSHRCNSTRFDYTPFRGKCDLVFIDASHEYANVVHDSTRALEIVAPNGLIVWDDYQACIPGVVRALNELSERLQLVRITHSRLVVHRPYPFDDVPAGNSQPWARV